MLKILPAAAQDLEDVRTLFGEYSRLVADALCFQNFDQELEALPGLYAPPGGVLLIARDGEAAAGCVALRQLDAGSGEMKRMYVRDAYRGSGLGRRLALAVIEEARSRKYASARCSTRWTRGFDSFPAPAFQLRAARENQKTLSSKQTAPGVGDAR